VNGEKVKINSTIVGTLTASWGGIIRDRPTYRVNLPLRIGLQAMKGNSFSPERKTFVDLEGKISDGREESISSFQKGPESRKSGSPSH